MADLKIKPAKLSDQIVAQLEHLLLEGSFKPGQKLPSERELAERFAVSRPSLREAIQKLEAKGLVSRRQGGGTYVCDNMMKQLTDPLFALMAQYPDSQFDFLEFRHALRGTEADHKKIKHFYDDICLQQQLQDSDAEAKAISQFYLAVAEASHNIMLLHLVRSLTPLTEQNIRLNLAALQQRDGDADKLNEHRRRLMQAVMSREPELARQASNGHLAYIEEALLDVSKERSRIERSLRRSQQA
jgi:GntR family transcriptional repressor for pyruvate dehydrogenase complex